MRNITYIFLKCILFQARGLPHIHGVGWIDKDYLKSKLYLLGLLLKPKFYQNDTILNRDIKLPIDSAFPQPCEFKC